MMECGILQRTCHEQCITFEAIPRMSLILLSMLRSVLALRLAASVSSLSVWRLLVSGWVWDMMRARAVPADM